MTSIYIRPLKVEDAKVSYSWRNDPEVWQYTGSKPDMYITNDIEKEWLEKALQRDNELRFAICISDTDEYVGNVQLTNINEHEAEFHIFIGEKKYWGGGIGTSATKLLIDYAFNVLKLKIVYLFVDKKNIIAIKAYIKAGFYEVQNGDNDKIGMNIVNEV